MKENDICFVCIANESIDTQEIQFKHPKKSLWFVSVNGCPENCHIEYQKCRKSKFTTEMVPFGKFHKAIRYKGNIYKILTKSNFRVVFVDKILDLEEKAWKIKNTSMI